MNHKRMRIWTLALAMALILATLTVTAFAEGKTITVGSNSTLDAALAQANNGDTIELLAGTYDAPSSSITKRVNLTSKANAVINGEVTYEFSDNQNDAKVSVSGITFNAKADGSDLVEGLVFSGNYTKDASDLQIEVSNCQFNGRAFGVSLHNAAKSFALTVTDCTFNTWCGINFGQYEGDPAVESRNTLTASNNQFLGSGYAVQVYGYNPTGPDGGWALNHYYADFADFTADYDSFIAKGTDYTYSKLSGEKALPLGYYVTNSAQLNAAHTSAAAGATIILAPGTYEISDLTFDGKNGITLQGAGMDKTILEDTDGTYLINLRAGDCSNLQFKDMTLQGNSASTALVKVADGTNCSGLSFDNVAFSGATYGIYLGNDSQSQTPADNIQISGCEFIGMTNSGIYAQRGNIAVDGTVFKEITSAEGTAAGILFDTGYFGDSKYSLSVTDCEFSNIIGTRNETKATGAISITGSGSVQQLVVKDNTFISNTYDLHIGKANEIPVIQNQELSSNGAMSVFIPYQNADYYVATFVSDKIIIDTVLNDANGKVLMPKITKKGYTFLGWKSSADGKLYDAGDMVEIDGNTTFTAQWVNNWGVIGGIVGGSVPEETFFTDVSSGAWYYDAVKFVYDYNLMNGVGNNKFNPTGTLTRAMVAQVLYNLDGASGSYPSVFTDVSNSAWYAKAVNWAAASGIVEGKGNNKFDPNAAVTRQEMATILYRYSELKGYDISKVDSLAGYKDAAKVSTWAKEAMGWAVENYVINGVGNNTLNPTGTATRAQVAQILMNYCNNVL